MRDAILARRIPIEELDQALADGWQLSGGAETYNGDGWAVLVFKRIDEVTDGRTD